MKRKDGASGRLVFVTVRHEIGKPGEAAAIIDEHDIVYRGLEAPAVKPSPQKAEAGEWRRELVPDAVQLFRYSALTFNGHRIHYDRDYVTREEGYPGLVVHGPLIATLLIDLVRRNAPTAKISEFSFRAVSPLFDGNAMSVNATPPEWTGCKALGGECRRQSRDDRRGKARMSRPLDGLLVVSLEQAIAAPYCTRLLADQGARVIKVERPDGGDFARAYDTRARGLASHFVWTNRSKESLALDLKSDQAIEALHAIIAKADVFVQNLAPGAVQRLGLGPAELRRENPRLVTCSISGYGAGGPAEQRKAYDLLIQAEAGFLSVTGSRDQMAKAGISIADIAAGVTAYHSILAALIHRGTTGAGDHHRSLDAGSDGRMDGVSDVFCHGWRRAAAPQRRGPRDHLPLRPL